MLRIGYPRVVFPASAEGDDDDAEEGIQTRAITRGDVNGASVDCEGPGRERRSRLLHRTEPILQTLTGAELVYIADRTKKPVVLWYEQELVHLHGLALLLLSGFHRIPATHILAGSKLSVRAIHVLAIALRGLLIRVLGRKKQNS